MKMRVVCSHRCQTVGFTRLIRTTALLSCLTYGLAFGQAAPVPAASPPAATPALNTPLDPEKQSLELEKLRAQIAKLKADTKAPWEPSAVALAPLASLLSVLGLIYSVIHQQKTALDLQQRQSDEAVAMQKRQAQSALELKSAELIFASRSPTMARARASLLGELNPDGISAKIFAAIDDGRSIDVGNAVAELRWELRAYIQGACDTL